MRWNRVGSLLVLILGGSAIVGCSDDGNPPSNQGGNGGAAGDGGTGGDGGGGGGGGCNHGCPSIGATQCSGETVQSCAPDTNNCRQWVALLDCATTGKVCDDGVTPATCVDAGTPTCSDGIKNQDETDTDCGGATCNKCDVGKTCGEDADCASNACDPVGKVCQAGATCNDGQQNGAETDVDCGGGACSTCDIGKSCLQNADCTSNTCDSNTAKCVAAATCSDGIKNQDETDIDCGGATCNPCGLGNACTQNSDCVTMNCDGGSMTCAAVGTCNDGIKNQDESDIDCGGATCNDCPVGDTCQDDGDCASGSCNTGGTNTCLPAGVPTCDDMVKNQDETDVDCGGATCTKCSIGETCSVHSDCTTGICDFVGTKTCINADPTYLVDEDFETANYQKFPWALAGTNKWDIENMAGECHGGAFCARTSLLHALGETTSFEVSLSVRKNMNVTFWAKTNTEPNEHFFRFYIDGVQQTQVSGQTPWTLYSYAVLATGPNGPNRVLKWEYTRSTFVDPNHVPWNQVWIDDIDMPEWNTEPSVPQLIRPANGKLTTNTKPTFQWQSFDPDFDPITYQMEWDTLPTFPNPTGTGEIQDTQFTPAQPLNDNTIYYWRVRAKDNSNYRWSNWSTPSSVEINSTYQYAAVWRQTKADQFNMNALSGVTVTAETVTNPFNNVSKQATTGLAFNGGTAAVNLNGLGTAAPGTSATLVINGSGDFNGGGTESGTVRIEGTLVGTYNPLVCIGSANYNINNIGNFVNDGTTSISFQTGSGVDNNGCSGTTNSFTATLSYQGANAPGTMISVPISFALFDSKKYWEKVQVIGTGTITIQILDADGNLIPDSVVPGNSTGFTARTIRLWDLNPITYPTIRLKATIPPGAVLDEWSVVGNDVFEWLFSNNGDLEGWVADDKNAVATAIAQGGVLRLNGLAAGIDPNVQYSFPQPIDATRFTTIEVRVRTSNNNQNDDPAIYWDSNYGSWDKNRSFEYPGTFLFAFQDLSYDLTVVPPLPGEPWQGFINGIRVDPAVQFYDTLGNPADGWFEIDRIAIH